MGQMKNNDNKRTSLDYFLLRLEKYFQSPVFFPHKNLKSKGRVLKNISLLKYIFDYTILNQMVGAGTN